jgi:glycosyltransferase involved in cell wall biosynthesis
LTDNVSAAAHDEPAVSVIISFLNAERFLTGAIESVYGQTCRRWELLLVDDGSKDDSTRIAEAHVARWPAQVRLLWHPDRANRGLAASRNLGVRHARGRAIAFLDADDVYEPHRLERCLQVLESDPLVDVVINSELYWHSESGTAAERPGPADDVKGPYARSNRRIPPPVLFASAMLTRSAVMPASCSLTIRREALLDVGLIPEEFRSHYEDQVLIAKLLLTRSAYVVPECLARYRQHSASMTAGNTVDTRRFVGAHEDEMPPRLRYLKWLRTHMETRDVGVPELIAVVRAEIAALESMGRHQQGASDAISLRKRFRHLASRVLSPDLFAYLERRGEQFSRARVRRRAIRCATEIERRLGGLSRMPPRILPDSQPRSPS